MAGLSPAPAPTKEGNGCTAMTRFLIKKLMIQLNISGGTFSEIRKELSIENPVRACHMAPKCPSHSTHREPCPTPQCYHPPMEKHTWPMQEHNQAQMPTPKLIHSHPFPGQTDRKPALSSSTDAHMRTRRHTRT